MKGKEHTWAGHWLPVLDNRTNVIQHGTEEVYMEGKPAGSSGGLPDNSGTRRLAYIILHPCPLPKEGALGCCMCEKMGGPEWQLSPRSWGPRVPQSSANRETSCDRQIKEKRVKELPAILHLKVCNIGSYRGTPRHQAP